MEQKIVKIQYECPSCGAKATSEICEYCGSRTNINTMNADLEYPIFNGEDMTGSKKSYVFPLFFGGFWEGTTLAVHVPFIIFGDQMFEGSALLSIAFNVFFFGIFHCIGIGCLIAAIKSFSRYRSIIDRGTYVTGTVYGYTEHNIKVLANIDGVLRFVFIKNDKEYRPYPVNSEVKLKVYKQQYIVLGS